MNMQRTQQVLRLTALVGVILVMTNCTYQAALQRLTPQEQSEFRAFSKIMSSTQVHTYLNNATPAGRVNYLREIGAAQRFQALDAQDRESVLAGFIRKGMSAEAMYFLWGEPFYTIGYTGHYEHWYYQGSSFSLAEYGNQPSDSGTVVEVYLIDGRVAWWLETVPTDIEDSGEGLRRP
jgi:hypothetical protein